MLLLPPPVPSILCDAFVSKYWHTHTHTHTLQAETYLNKVLLVVNVASNCGFTASNYKDLVELHKRYEGKDFEILAFPCNQFGGQEPGSNEQIKEFTRRYGVEFPVTEKVVMKLFLLLLLSLFLSCRLVFLAIQVSDNSIAIVFLFSSFLSFEKTGLAGGCKRAEHTSFLQVSQGEGAKELLGERCKVELREVSCRQEWQCREQILQHDKPLGHSARHWQASLNAFHCSFALFSVEGKKKRKIQVKV